MNSNNTEKRITHSPTTNLLANRRKTTIVTKFQAPPLIRPEVQPPTQFTQVTHRVHHTVKIDSDWLSIVALPTFISLAMLIALAFTALSTQNRTPSIPNTVTTTERN